MRLPSTLFCQGVGCGGAPAEHVPPPTPGRLPRRRSRRATRCSSPWARAAQGWRACARCERYGRCARCARSRGEKEGRTRQGMQALASAPLPCACGALAGVPPRTPLTPPPPPCPPAQLPRAALHRGVLPGGGAPAHERGGHAVLLPLHLWRHRDRAVHGRLPQGTRARAGRRRQVHAEGGESIERARAAAGPAGGAGAHPPLHRPASTRAAPPSRLRPTPASLAAARARAGPASPAATPRRGRPAAAPSTPRALTTWASPSSLCSSP